MPKRRKKFGRSQKRGGDRKLGDSGDGLEYVPLVRAQNQCDQMKSTHAADLATLKIKYTSVIKDQQSELQRAKVKYKSTVREQQRRHSEHIQKHKDEMM